ncbi:hypothetical protein EHO61_12150 [Leptospira fluminis]|uniref:Uncharacterized protein n=1 Tax=Leptospira fluminis TaxID=2484979 RepID=A0A4R9GLX7_9LEPT|nr:hypothetical protein [Leptospira fluminis]TGK17170.1 hypothetical protein EHO61_12150 [Leptospira fluminis]
MAKGYHSRSPEEFREFLKQVQKKGKERSRTKFILFLDLILLLFIFAVVARLINPLAFTGRKESKPTQDSEIRILVSADREGGKEVPVFFLFMTNSSGKEIRYPDRQTEFIGKISTSSGLSCLEEEWKIPEKTILPGKTEFFRYEADEASVRNLPPDCKIPKSNFWTNITKNFLKAKERDFELQIRRKEETLRLRIEKV